MNYICVVLQNLYCLKYENIKFKKYKYFVGVDNGCLYFLKKKKKMNFSIGDFDSISSNQYILLKKYSEKIIKLPKEKNITDTEFTINYLFKKKKNIKIEIFGAFGGRMDHFLCNLIFLFKNIKKQNINKIKFINLQNSINFYISGKYKIKKENNKKYFSCIFLENIKNLNLTKCKYEIKKRKIYSPTCYISNEFIKNFFYLSFDNGIVLLIQSKDKTN